MIEVKVVNAKPYTPESLAAEITKAFHDAGLRLLSECYWDAESQSFEWRAI